MTLLLLFQQGTPATVIATAGRRGQYAQPLTGTVQRLITGTAERKR